MNKENQEKNLKLGFKKIKTQGKNDAACCAGLDCCASSAGGGSSPSAAPILAARAARGEVASGVAAAWREITVGKNKQGAQAATKDAPEGTPAEGKTATSASTDASKTEATPAATDTTAASAATSAAARAAAATEATSTVSPAGSSVTPSAGPAGGGMGGSGQQPTTLTGKLEITNLEAGVLEVMAKQDRPPTQVAGGAPIYAASAATMT